MHSIISFWLMMMLCIETSLSVIVRSKSSLQCLSCKLKESIAFLKWSALALRSLEKSVLLMWTFFTFDGFRFVLCLSFERKKTRKIKTTPASIFYPGHHGFSNHRWLPVKSSTFTKAALQKSHFLPTTRWNLVPFDRLRWKNDQLLIKKKIKLIYTTPALAITALSSAKSQKKKTWKQSSRTSLVCTRPLQVMKKSFELSSFFSIGKQCLNAAHCRWSKRFVCSCYDYRLSMLSWLENEKKNPRRGCEQAKHNLQTATAVGGDEETPCVRSWS